MSQQEKNYNFIEKDCMETLTFPKANLWKARQHFKIHRRNFHRNEPNGKICPYKEDCTTINKNSGGKMCLKPLVLKEELDSGDRGSHREAGSFKHEHIEWKFW